IKKSLSFRGSKLGLQKSGLSPRKSFARECEGRYLLPRLFSSHTSKKEMVMKKLVLSLLAVGVVQANAAVMLIARCQTEQYGAEYGTTVVLTHDLRSSTYTLEVTKPWLGGENTVVEEATVDGSRPMPMGAPVYYSSN